MKDVQPAGNWNNQNQLFLTFAGGAKDSFGLASVMMLIPNKNNNTYLFKTLATNTSY